MDWTVEVDVSEIRDHIRNRIREVAEAGWSAITEDQQDAWSDASPS